MEDQSAVTKVPETKSKQNFWSKFQELRNKKVFPLAVLIALLVVLFGAAGISFALYQQPDNVLDSALKNALTSKHVVFKGSLATSQAKAPLMVNFNGQAAQQELASDLVVSAGSGAQAWKVSGSVVYDKTQTLYLRLNGLDDLLTKSSGDNPQLKQVYGQIIAKINNIWFKLSKDDLNQMSGSSGDNILTCYQKFSDTLTAGSDQGKLTDLYSKHRFITIEKSLPDETINGVSSFHYQLKINPDQEKQFLNGLRQLDSVKKFETCSGGTFNAEAMANKSTTKDEKLEVWIDKWSHAFTRLKQSDTTKDGTKASFDSTFDFGKTVTITPPTKATDLKDLFMQFQTPTV